ncbi:MAG: nitronate monooxygenase [Pseudomonadota bacterium]
MIDTQLTRRFGLIFPIISFPEPWIATGHLAAEICKAGALGVVGAGPCDRDWITTQFETAGNTSIACGLYSNRLAREPEMLDFVLSLKPRAIYLSGADPRPFAEIIHKQKCRLICEARSVDEFDTILEAGAEVLVIRSERENHSNSAETPFSLVTEASDYLYTRDDDVILVASGGVIDARGLAAMLALGADGVCMGRRLWATEESAISGDALNQTLGPFGRLIKDAPAMRPLLRTIGMRAERILSHMPRKIVNEPPGPSAIGELGQDYVLEDFSKTVKPEKYPDDQ